MQKTADGLKEGVQKPVFLNVSGIGRAPTSLIVFFQKQEKVFVRVPNDLKCYENRDFTVLTIVWYPNVLKKQRENERERSHE